MNRSVVIRKTDRFVEPLMVNNELLVLLPRRDKVVRNGMEHFSVDLSLVEMSKLCHRQRA